MSALVVVPMSLRDRLIAWLERELPWYDEAAAKSRQERFDAQIARSRRVQAEATIAIENAQRAHRAHLRSSYRRASARLGRR